jgi:hypothetical protein
MWAPVVVEIDPLRDRGHGVNGTLYLVSPGDFNTILELPGQSFDAGAEIAGHEWDRARDALTQPVATYERNRDYWHHEPAGP